MKKDLDRRSFIVGCGLLTFSSAGVFFTGCGGTNNDDGKKKGNDKKKPGQKVDIEKKDKTITMSQANLDTLKSRGYIEVSAGDVPTEKLLVFNYDNKFYGFSSVCPHKQGELKIENATTIRCQKHDVQTFTNKGATNKAKTKSNLKLNTLEIKVS